MTNTANNNKFFELIEVTSPDEFRDYCMNNQSDLCVNEIYGLDLPELYEQAEEAITLYIQSDGFPRTESRKMAQELLYRMAVARVDGVEVSTSTVLAAAGYRPSDFMAKVGLTLNEEDFATLWE
jgi:hypothetical protein